VCFGYHAVLRCHNFQDDRKCHINLYHTQAQPLTIIHGHSISSARMYVPKARLENVRGRKREFNFNIYKYMHKFICIQTPAQVSLHSHANCILHTRKRTLSHIGTHTYLSTCANVCVYGCIHTRLNTHINHTHTVSFKLVG